MGSRKADLTKSQPAVLAQFTHNDCSSSAPCYPPLQKALQMEGHLHSALPQLPRLIVPLVFDVIDLSATEWRPMSRRDSARGLSSRATTPAASKSNHKRTSSRAPSEHSENVLSSSSNAAFSCNASAHAHDALYPYRASYQAMPSTGRTLLHYSIVLVEAPIDTNARTSSPSARRYATQSRSVAASSRLYVHKKASMEATLPSTSKQLVIVGSSSPREIRGPFPSQNGYRPHSTKLPLTSCVRKTR